MRTAGTVRTAQAMRASLHAVNPARTKCFLVSERHSCHWKNLNDVVIFFAYTSLPN